ncbi:polysaccharide biosynthesis tyrosine autokinase [Granulicella sp. dw_53]|uniref:GumC family protein n=1 Tax=Granulicella sp. dw_53 TaxID=2719792 RepID=UPI001BD4518F|nr:polysaccharide biosynthesis tyrosine autokinase [Granulicella sp. dw_53]
MDHLDTDFSLSRRQYPSIPLSTALSDSSTPAENQTLPGLFRILRRRWRVVSIVTLATLVLGILVCLLLTPRYSSLASIEINRAESEESTATPGTGPPPTADEIKMDINTAITILQSDGLALGVIQDLNLISKPLYRKAVDSLEQGKPLNQAPKTQQKAIKIFENNLKVESPDNTRLINVTFSDPDANVAADVTNTLSRRFIENNLERRQKSTIQVSYWLQKELDDLKKQVEDSEQKLANYERKTGLAGIQITGSSTGEGASSVTISPKNTVTERLFGLNQELTAAEANRISTETLYRLVQTQDPEVVLGLGSMSISSAEGGGPGALTADGGIQLVRSLRAQEVALIQGYAADAVKYGANNPRLTQTQQQLEAVRQQLKAELQRISKRAENAYLYAKNNEGTIRQQFTKQQSSANSLADDTVQLQVLAQEAYSNRALYESLFSKLQTASLASGVRATRIDLVEQARPAGIPAFPKWEMVLPALAAASLLFGISSAFLRESLDETVRTSNDLGEVANLTAFAYIPSIQLQGQDESDAIGSKLIHAPKSPFSEGFRTLRTSITLETASYSQKIFLVTSPLGGDGKTTVTFNLGVAFAQHGARVLLIDGDLRNPELHRLFGCEIAPGLGDLQTPVIGPEVKGIVQHAALSTLFILPAGQLREFPAEFFDSEAFASLLASCARHYDYVLIDSPPVLSVADASIIASKATGTITVLRSRRTTRPIFSSSVNTLRKTGTPTIGIILNDVRNPTLDGFHNYAYTRQKGA